MKFFTTASNFRLTASIFRVLLALSLILTSCSGADGTGEEVTDSSNQTVEITEGSLASDAGFGIIYYTGSIATEWSAEVVEGADFVSFSGFEQMTIKGGVVTSTGKNMLYFYYEQNGTYYDRAIQIDFTFDGAEPVSLNLSQLSTSSEDSPYNSADKSPRWNEIPAMVEDDNYFYVTHSTTLTDGSEVRNYSLCFDIENRAAAWVAFPYHKIYTGSVGYNSSWTYDPKIPAEYQANLSYSYSSYGGNSYDRGHQMASADRQATLEMNRQTFYYSNMTPQLGTLNQNTWADFEIKVRNQVCTDTLFVVTGADYTTTIGTTTDASGNACPIPGAYYKVLLRTRTGYTGKAVTECSADELQAIGFWFEHKYYSSIPDPVTVKEIEERTGFTFFPNIPEEVKASYKSVDWSF